MLLTNAKQITTMEMIIIMNLLEAIQSIRNIALNMQDLDDEGLTQDGFTVEECGGQIEHLCNCVTDIIGFEIL
jgi:hypothetical protein